MSCTTRAWYNTSPVFSKRSGPRCQYGRASCSPSSSSPSSSSSFRLRWVLATRALQAAPSNFSLSMSWATHAALRNNLPLRLSFAAPRLRRSWSSGASTSCGSQMMMRMFAVDLLTRSKMFSGVAWAVTTAVERERTGRRGTSYSASVVRQSILCCASGAARSTYSRASPVLSCTLTHVEAGP